MKSLLRMHDLKYLIIRKNDNYWMSLYIGLIAGTFTLPFALCNAVIFPAAIRIYTVLKGYLTFVTYGIFGYTNVMTEEEQLEMQEQMTPKIRAIKLDPEQMRKFLQDMGLKPEEDSKD